MKFIDLTDTLECVSRQVNSAFYKTFDLTYDLKKADVALCGAKQFKNNHNIKYIACPMTNINHINVRDSKMFYLNNPKELIGVRSTAEHTMLLIMMLLRPFMANYDMQRPMVPFRRLCGLSLGIIGFGRIGLQVYHLATAFGMKVKSFDIRNTLDRKNSLLEVLNCDIISLHTNVSKDMTPILTNKELCLIRNGSYLINTSRAGAIDEKALYKHLSRLGGYASDVTEDDKFYRKLKAIADSRNILLSPHVGGYTYEDLTYTSELVYNKLMEEINVNNEK